MVVASASGGAWPSSAVAGRVYRVAETEKEIEAVAVGAGRVFWSTWDGSSASIYSSYPAGDRRRLVRADASQFDWVFPSLWSSRARVIGDLTYRYSDPDAEYSDTLITASGAVDARALQPLELSPDERIQDVDGHRVVTTTVTATANRRTVRARIRDLALADPVARIVGRPETRNVGGFSADAEARVAGRYLALLRHGRRPTITVFDIGTNRALWSVRLPRWRGLSNSASYGRGITWDLARSGSIAAALASSATGSRLRQLGWAAPHTPFRRITRRVELRQPFSIDNGTLTYVRGTRRNHMQIVERLLGRPGVRALSGEIPNEALVATDGQTLAAVIAGKGAQRCLLAARRPFSSTARWRC